MHLQGSNQFKVHSFRWKAIFDLEYYKPAKSFRWNPNKELLLSMGANEIRKHRLESIEGRIEHYLVATTFVFTGEHRCPPQGSYDDEPVDQITIPSTFKSLLF